jgi:hypothetical protein
MSPDIRAIDTNSAYCTKISTGAYYGDKDCSHLVWDAAGNHAKCSLFCTKTKKPQALRMGRDLQYLRCKACRDCTLITHKESPA